MASAEPKKTAIELVNADIKDMVIELTPKGLKKAARAVLLGQPVTLFVDYRFFGAQVRDHIDAVCADAPDAA